MKSDKGFTLVEILIVVMILAIIAAVALPKFSNASQVARASMLADDLRIMRMQIEVFRGQHCGVSPGYPDCDISQAPDAESFVAQMTGRTTAMGGVPGPGERAFGPYMREMPRNPLNNLNTVEIIADDDAFPDAADDSHGWIYQPKTQTLRADSPGADDGGKAYFSY